MITKTIHSDLSEAGIKQVIRSITGLKRITRKRVERAERRIALEIRDRADVLFSRALADDIIGAPDNEPMVRVEINKEGGGYVVIASGPDAVFVEFGAGVYHNGPAGSSPHPEGAENGYTIGGYGKGLGQRQTWGFRKNGEVVLTHGTPAAMPMYKAQKYVVQRIYTILEDEFGKG